MVRAAVSGAIDYARSDPTDINWRLKQKLVLHEVQRREEVLFLSLVHRQWLAYISHGGLTEESFSAVKESANKSLDQLQSTIFPWLEAEKPAPKLERKNDTIVNNAPQLDDETKKLVEQYKTWQKHRQEEKPEGQ